LEKFYSSVIKIILLILLLQSDNMKMIQKVQEKSELEVRNSINVDGKLYYNDGVGTWNTINLKKELCNEFPQLKEKMSKFSYEMLFYRDFESLKNFIKELKDKKVMPVLMWIYKE
jgi:hypothetical protein